VSALPAQRSWRACAVLPAHGSSRAGGAWRARRPVRARARGFTLIEILVALLILGIMTGLGYETYHAARISAERSEEALKRSREIEFGMRMMIMDFMQMVPRPVRDPLGQSRIPALHGYGGNGTTAGVGNSAFGGSALGSDFTQQFKSQHFNSDPGFQSSLGGGSSTTTVPLAELTRAGWSNTAGQQRSTLQRVTYALVDDTVKRSYTTALDTVLATQPQIQDLFGGVKTVQLRYLDGNQTWQAQWPPPNLPQNEGLWVRPVAVEITIEFKDWGRVQRVIEVAG
jgi:general secretion pathway protein J